MDDDFDKDDLPATQIKPKPVKGISNRLPDIPEGYQDCYWCGRKFLEKDMKKDRKYDIIVWLCKGCQP